MKYKPITITLLCSLTASLGIIIHGQKERNELAHAASLDVGDGPKINCSECVNSGDFCNEIDTVSPVMLGAKCGTNMNKEDAELMKKILNQCDGKEGKKQAASTKFRVDSIVSAIRNCSPTKRYGCKAAKIKDANGKEIDERVSPGGAYVYRWQNVVEETTSPGYPVCGERHYCETTNKVERPEDCEGKPPNG
jgi:hypothetical protein